MNRRAFLAAAAVSLFSPRAFASTPVIGSAPEDRYSNLNNWTLDPAAHPLASFTPTSRTMTVLWVGQSNMAQYANALYAPAHAGNQFEFLYGDGTLRNLVEPMMGPGSAPCIGSWFSQFGDDIIAAGKAENVVHCIAAIGGRPSTAFAIGGAYHSMITTACFRLLDAGFAPTFIGLGQGETDCLFGNPATTWTGSWAGVIDVVRNIGIAAPWYVATETCNAGVIDPTIQAAQASILTMRPNLFAGPNIDAVGAGYRYDNTHFNAAGCAAVAAAWAAVAPML